MQDIIQHQSSCALLLSVKFNIVAVVILNCCLYKPYLWNGTKTWCL